jgi:hypothetical protein
MDNWIRISTLLNRVCNVFQRLFEERYVRSTGNNWQDGAQNAAKFLKGEGVSLQTLTRTQEEVLKEGILQDWDISLLYAILTKAEWNGFTPKMKEENGYILKLKNIRNDVVHNGKMDLSNEEFERIWKEVLELMAKLGGKVDDVDLIRTLSKYFEDR